jgi:TPR repeat protein
MFNSDYGYALKVLRPIVTDPFADNYVACAQYIVGRILHEGLAAHEQSDEGRKYLRDAYDNGSEDARAYLRFLDSQKGSDPV